MRQKCTKFGRKREHFLHDIFRAVKIDKTLLGENEKGSPVTRRHWKSRRSAVWRRRLRYEKASKRTRPMFMILSDHLLENTVTESLTKQTRWRMNWKCLPEYA